MQYILRFLIGGAVVCLFAALGDALKPKSFAGLFSAAPSIALASLGLAALLAVVFAAGATLDFCAQLDQIAARLSPDHSPTLVSAPGEKERGSLTNAAGVGVSLPDSGQGPQTNLPAAVPAAWRGVGSPMSG